MKDTIVKINNTFLNVDVHREDRIETGIVFIENINYLISDGTTGYSYIGCGGVELRVQGTVAEILQKIKQTAVF